ncbi:membrane hypothetical protein [Candidatus Terasakiella magnetica]|uniref:Uncharacterized protein n=1 Tax=Candidatus Terasakiella magnetica TaxID=1867952 RepID=A0A1C3RJD8_9PROT|nr:hypothetical protein [Candidatus Terasakiella magnetica]SCA57376.1 membrane hypothetical protein [Candidatus Terasakiella magnetica]
MSEENTKPDQEQNVRPIKNKTDLSAEIDKLIFITREASQDNISSKKTRKLQKELILLKKELHNQKDDTSDFWKTYDKFLEIEHTMKSPMEVWKQTIMGLFFLYVIIIFASMFVDTDLFGLKSEEKTKLIIFSVLGAFALLITKTYEDILKKKKNLLVELLSFGIHFLLAVIVSFVVISLFFNEGADQKQNQEIAFATPELLAFIFGYSTKIVVLALNKMVEKASKMIKAI